MIGIENLSYVIGNRTILDEVDLTIADGDRVAVVGPNGAGKSTLLKIIQGKLDPTNGRIITSKGSGTIGYMPQQLSDLGKLPDMTVLDFMLSGRELDTLSAEIERRLRDLDVPGLSEKEYLRLSVEYSEAFEKFMAAGGYDAEGELLEVLLGMGLSGIDLDGNVQTLSGGQKTKLAFARVLFANPRIMILDEPTNHLDEDTIDWVVEYLKRFLGTLIMVSHVPSVLDELVTRIVYLDGTGKSAIFRGNFSEFKAKKDRLDATQTKLREQQDKEAEELKTFIARWRGRKPKQVADREKKLERLEGRLVDSPTAQAQISIAFPVSVQPVQKVLETEDIWKSFGDKNVLHDVNVTFYRGERVAIMGPNGAGKSTLLKIIAGRLLPDSGRVSFGDRVDPGYYAQEHESLNASRTVLQEMMSAPGISQSRARSVLAHFLFQGDRTSTNIDALSLGEKSRLALAKLVASGHNLLLLDEPTNHLDVFARDQVMKALAAYEGTVLIVTHDRAFLEGIGAEKVLLLPEHKFGFVGQL